MLLRPSNTLLLDEPTNHLDLDSKEVLLDALVDYGGTLIFVSHDRYFVERLATKIIEVGSGTAIVYPGTYNEFLWHKAQTEGKVQSSKSKVESKVQKVESGRAHKKTAEHAVPPPHEKTPQRPNREDQKRADADARRQQRADQARRARIDDLEARIAECENAIREIEQTMSAPGFYGDRTAAQPVIDQHQALMWKVGDLMHQWEELQSTVSR
jgi:ATP-binding cassette subfamily F protein 3